jgi:rhodanese-related sulfurtransferase
VAQIREIDPRELAGLMEDASKDIRLIDVRSPTEIAHGAISRAESLPLHLLPLQADAIEKSSTVVFYCRSGARSAQACAFLAARGYEQVFNLRGGIVAWVRQGLPIESVPAALCG